MQRPQPRHHKLLSDSISPQKTAFHESKTLNRMQIKNEIQRIQEAMDTQEISLLNHLEEVKQAEAREQLNRFKRLKEETKKILEGDVEDQRPPAPKRDSNGVVQRRPRSAGRPTDRG